MIDEQLFNIAKKYKIPDIMIGYYWGWYKANRFYDKNNNKKNTTLIGFEISLKKIMEVPK